MKQVVFAVFLIAMASLTGCLNEEDSPVDDKTDDSSSDTTEDNSDTDDELIDPVGTDGGYTPPDESSIRMDNGQRGYWLHTDGEPEEYVSCTEQGWHSYENYATEYTIYCDLDNRYDSGPQIWVNKTEKTVTVECIKHHDDEYCKNYSVNEQSIYLLFHSQEGFTERIRVDLISRLFNNPDNEYRTYFFKNEFTLQFEPVWFSAEYDNISELYFPEQTNSRVF